MRVEFHRLARAHERLEFMHCVFAYLYFVRDARGCLENDGFGQNVDYFTRDLANHALLPSAWARRR